MFSDLISEYQQYQEATVDDYDSPDASATSRDITGLPRAACPPAVERPSVAVGKAAVAEPLAVVASAKRIPVFFIKEAARLGAKYS